MNKKSIDELIKEYSDLWGKWHTTKSEAEEYEKILKNLEDEILSHIPAQIKSNLKKE